MNESSRDQLLVSILVAARRLGLILVFSGVFVSRQSRHPAEKKKTKFYSSNITKVGALLDDVKLLFAHWNSGLTVDENLKQFVRENIFGKASRSRIGDFLPVFRRRYLNSPDVFGALKILVDGAVPAEILNRILFFHAALEDVLLHDFVTEVLAGYSTKGKIEVEIGETKEIISGWVNEGKTSGQWSEYTILKVARGLSAALREFGILRGTVKKRLLSHSLPVEVFVYVALWLNRNQPSGIRLIHDPEWRLFFLTPDAVERLFLEAHQRRLVEYQAAGSVVRIEFPFQTLEEYTHALVDRKY